MGTTWISIFISVIGFFWCFPKVYLREKMIPHTHFTLALHLLSFLLSAFFMDYQSVNMMEWSFIALGSIIYCAATIFYLAREALLDIGFLCITEHDSHIFFSLNVEISWRMMALWKAYFWIGACCRESIWWALMNKPLDTFLLGNNTWLDRDTWVKMVIILPGAC